MRISDWSSDVCSSDLRHQNGRPAFGALDLDKIARPEILDTDDAAINMPVKAHRLKADEVGVIETVLLLVYLGQARAVHVKFRAPHRLRLVAVADALDRKSTRLISSH